MLALNADAHPLMKRMHKPDPTRLLNVQDKRSVVPVELAEVEAWLLGTIEEATALLKLPAVEDIKAGPVLATPASEFRARGRGHNVAVE